MRSRLINVVLMLAVVALSIALSITLARGARQRAMEVPASGEFTAANVVADETVADVDEDVLLLAAAFMPFEAHEFDPSVQNPGTGEASQDGADGAARERPIGESDGPRDWRDRAGDNRREGGRRREHQGGQRPMTEEMAARCLEIAREVDPEIAQRLSDARTRNPEEFERQLQAGGFGRRLLALAHLKTRDPILYGQKIGELSSAVQIERVARELRELKATPDASLGKIEEVEGRLRTLLQVQLAMSIKARGDMLCRFEERMQHLKDDLDREARNFQATIDARMAYLVEKSDEDASAALEPAAQPADAPARSESAADAG